MTMRDDHRKSPRNSTHLLRKLNPHCSVALEAAANLLQAITDAPHLLRAANAWPLLSVSAITSENPVISQAELLEAIHPTLVAHFQPALLARLQTLVYRSLDAAALASLVRLKLAKVAERLRHQYDIALTLDDALTDSLAQLCLARGSGARSVDAFLNQRILPAVSRELLSRMAKGSTSEGSPRGIPAGIPLSMSPKGTSFDQRKSLWDGAPLEGSLVIDLVDHDVRAAASATTGHPVSVGI
ncbi:hypothetical protein R69919_03331 [Paraburkholderia gardini]|nr:hypothetical protein R69919_03331 [Paraburkholderia gardini]